MTPPLAQENRPRVHLMAPFTVQSGLGTGARALYHVLRAAPVDLSVAAYTIGHEFHASHPFDLGDVPSYPLNHSGLAPDVAIAYQNADGFDVFLDRAGSAFLEARRKVGYWVWELAEFPKEWSRYAPPLDEIWVPSHYVKESIGRAVACPVYVVPYALFEMPPAKTEFRRRFGIAEGEFVFCCLFDASSYVERKNPRALIEAFRIVRRTTPNVRLLMKVTHPHLLVDYLDANACRIDPDEGITVFSENVDYAGVLGLIDEADCLVSPHRAEGFGLTMAEALLLAKPVVATDYGGSRDFLSEITGFPVPFTLTRIKNDLGPYKAGQAWADVDPAALAGRMSEVIENINGARGRAQAGRDLIRAAFSAPAIAAELVRARRI